MISYRLYFIVLYFYLKINRISTIYILYIPYYYIFNKTNKNILKKDKKSNSVDFNIYHDMNNLARDNSN